MILYLQEWTEYYFNCSVHARHGNIEEGKKGLREIILKAPSERLRKTANKNLFSISPILLPPPSAA